VVKKVPKIFFLVVVRVGPGTTNKKPLILAMRYGSDTTNRTVLQLAIRSAIVDMGIIGSSKDGHPRNELSNSREFGCVLSSSRGHFNNVTKLFRPEKKESQ
jgi:hypothetical protein